MKNINPIYLLHEGIYTNKIIELNPKSKEVLSDLLQKGNPFRQKLAAAIRATHNSDWNPAIYLRELKQKIINLEKELSTATDTVQRQEIKRQLRNKRANLRHIRKYGMLDSSGRNTNMDAIGRIGQDMEILLEPMGLTSEYKKVEKTVVPNTFGNKIRKLVGMKPKTETEVNYVSTGGGFKKPTIWDRKHSLKKGPFKA